MFSTAPVLWGSPLMLGCVQAGAAHVLRRCLATAIFERSTADASAAGAAARGCHSASLLAASPAAAQAAAAAAAAASAAGIPSGLLELVRPARRQDRTPQATAAADMAFQQYLCLQAAAGRGGAPAGGQQRRRYHAGRPCHSLPAEQAQEPYQPRADPHRLLHPTACGPAADALAALGRRHGVPDTGSYLAAVQRLQPLRQLALLQHAEGVAWHLQSLGIAGERLARLLQHCPALFSYPPVERAAPLLGEAMGPRVGLTAAQAAEVLVHRPALANSRNLMPTVVRLVVEQYRDALLQDCTA